MTTYYPWKIQIETTNRCNAHCKYCPHDRIQRDIADMDMDLFRKIIDDCKEFPLGTLLPFLNGEPFLDKFLFKRLEIIDEELDVRTKIFTNASVLTEEKLQRLKTFDNIELDYSMMGGPNKEKYEAITGLDYDNFIRKEKLIREYFPEAGKHMGYGFNWTGHIDSPRKTQRLDTRCHRTNEMTILVDGRVSLCCMDMHGEWILGDLKRQSILEVFNQKPASFYRNNKRGNIYPCKFCNVLGTSKVPPPKVLKS